jgi:hypothetical protein
MLSEDEPGGWHLSVSYSPATSRGAWRYPTVEELDEARGSLTPHGVRFAMFLPPEEDNVTSMTLAFIS